MKDLRQMLKSGAIKFCLLLTLSVFGQAQTEVQKPPLNQPFKRQIKGDETHSFQFDVKAGFYARAEVDQKNIDVVIKIIL